MAAAHIDETNGSKSTGGKALAYRDENFGQKLGIVEGVSGYRFSSEYFSGAFLARKLKIAEAQLSRKKNGRAPISDWELSKLVELYRLNEYTLEGLPLDYSLFKLDSQEFTKTLRNARVGTYGGSSIAAARSFLLEEAVFAKAARSTDKIEADAAAGKQLKIELFRKRMARRAGGFGVAPAEGQAVPNFDTTEQVYFKISTPSAGHLYVLSDLIDIEMSCLMPSCFAEETVVEESKIRIPTESGYLDVVGPPGSYRLFAIHCTQKLHMSWAIYDKMLDEPGIVPEAELPKLVETLKDIRTDGGEFKVATKDYRVLR